MKKLKLNSKEDIRIAIRRRGVEIAQNMTDDEFFLSEEFKNYATKMADFILRHFKMHSLDIQYNISPEAYIAYTDDKKIVLNTGNSLARAPKLLEKRFKVNMGILFHECAHKLFIDFSIDKKIQSKLQSGKLYGKFPDCTPEEKAIRSDIEDVLKSPYGNSLISIYADLSNYIDDGHDEKAMKRCFPGFIAECIQTADDVQMERTEPLDEMVANGVPRMGILSSTILQYAKNEYYRFNKSDGCEEYLSFMTDLEPIIDAAVAEDDYAARWDYINQLMVMLWSDVRSLFPKDLNQIPTNSNNSTSGNNGASDSNSTEASAASPEEVQSVIDSIINAVNAANHAAAAPINGSGTAIKPKAILAGSSGNNGDDAFAQVMDQIATEKAQKDIQKALDQAEMDLIRNRNVPLIHRNIRLKIKRHNEVKPNNYNAIASDVAPFVKRLVKEMKDLLREMNEESIQHHRSFGPIIEVSESYRPDNAFFAKKKLPADLPNMAVCVLIDQSGSMDGKKIAAARKTAIMLEQFAYSMDIPIMIAGHNVGGNSVNLQIYSDFLSANHMADRLSLAGIDCGGRNRDGLPIHACCSLLEKRSEQVKLMIVISDGAPNDYGYSGKEAREDISAIVKSFRRKGLLIYGAAIDEDQEIIEKIYGKGFLSIENLDKLPQTLVRLIRQQIF